MRSEHNTPQVDASAAYLLRLNLRDSTVEDNVRKRPFLPIIFDPPPFRAIRVCCKNTKLFIYDASFLSKRLLLSAQNVLFRMIKTTANRATFSLTKC